MPFERFCRAAFEQAASLAPVHNVARDLLVAQLRADAETQLGPQLAATAIAAFEKLPLIHGGPHRCFVLDERVLSSLLVGDCIAKAGGAGALIWYGDTTVSLRSKGRRGPGWFTVGGERIAIFDVPSRYHDIPIASDRLAPRFNPAFVRALAGTPLENGLQRAGTAIETIPATTFADAIRILNGEIWKEISGAVPLLQLDTGSIACLIAEHLKENSSPIRQILLDRQSRVAWLALVAGLQYGPVQEFISWNTDFFWLVEGGRRYALACSDTTLVPPQSSGVTPIKLEAQPLIDALVAGRLFPNLYLTHLALLWLPRILMTGGAYQISYDALPRPRLARGIATGEAQPMPLATVQDPTSILTYGALDLQHPAVEAALSDIRERRRWSAEALLPVTTRALMGDLAVLKNSSRWKRHSTARLSDSPVTSAPTSQQGTLVFSSTQEEQV